MTVTVPVPEHPCPGCGSPRSSIASTGELPARSAGEIRIGTLLVARCCDARIEVVVDGTRLRPDLADVSWERLCAINRRLYELAPEAAP